MLRAEERELLTDLLRPPEGYGLHSAVGTTFALDLLSLMQVPLAFLHHGGWLRAENDEPDPLAMLEALRRCADGLTVFAQAGQIKLPDNLPRLATLLEPCVCEVLAPNPAGVFHPKVWVLRLVNDKDASDVCYRVLCLSRNLTFDRSWDTALALEGQLRARGAPNVRGNRPLADFIAALPDLGTLSKQRRQSVLGMAEELRRVEFRPPPGFEIEAFWHGGLESSGEPLTNVRGRVLVVAPFVSAGFLAGLTGQSGKVSLVSRLESLDALPHDLLARCHELHVMHRQTAGDDLDETTADPDEPELDGLHAKLFILDDGWHARLFTGSFNATDAAFHHNVEFMIELRGKRSDCGVEAMMGDDEKAKDGTRFAELLTPYDLSNRTETTPDATEEEWEELCRMMKREVFAAGYALQAQAEDETWQLRLHAASILPLRAGLELRAWPTTLTPSHARSLGGQTEVRFTHLTMDAITAWTAFQLTAHGRQCSWVMKLPIEGLEHELRVRQLLKDMLSDRKQFLRLLGLLLHLEDASAGGPATKTRHGFTGSTTQDADEPLLEMLLRVAHRNPAALERIQGYLTELAEHAPVDADFQRVWRPLAEAMELS